MKKLLKITLALCFSLAAILALLPAAKVHAASASEYGYTWPIEGQTFGRGFTSSHDALDIVADTGTPVKAIKAGTVYCASTASTSASAYCSTCKFYGAGYHVTVRHTDGRVSMYCHLNSVNTSAGATVSAGQKVGTVGSTGNSTGPHLHLSMYGGVPMNDSNVLDPLVYLSPFSNIYVDGITETSATIHGIFGAYGPTVVNAGFYLGTTTNNMKKVTETLNTNGYYNGVAMDSIYYGTSKWYGTLKPGTTYYYRLWISRDGREYVSAIQSFTTACTHSWGGWVTTKSASCTAAGTQTATCSKCSQTKTQSISALGHNYSSAYTVDKAATCTTAGTKSYHCTRCSATTGSVSIPAEGHNWVHKPLQSFAATCTAKGTKHYACSKCSQTKSESVAALGHNPVSIPKMDATCTSAGSTEGSICSRCSHVIKQSTSIPKQGHSWGGWVVIKAPTTTAEGLSRRTCQSCKNTEDQVTARLASSSHTHSFGNWTVKKEATCEEDGQNTRTCSGCGAVETATAKATGHTFRGWTVKKEATVDSEGILANKCTHCSYEDTAAMPKLPPIEEGLDENPSNPSEPLEPSLPATPSDQNDEHQWEEAESETAAPADDTEEEQASFAPILLLFVCVLAGGGLLSGLFFLIKKYKVK